jgi:hypothetical protein
MFSLKLKKLCTPSYIYLVLSIVTMLLIYLQNIDNTSLYCVGSYECEVVNTTFIFLINIVYILFWTWILNLICKEGYSGLSWFLVLAPYLLSFILIALLMINN